VEQIRPSLEIQPPADLSAIGDVGSRFESAWQPEQSLDAISAYLPPPDDPNYLGMFIDLACRDLHLRLQHNLPVTAADYLKQFPELQACTTAVVELIRTEYGQRKYRDPTFDANGFFAGYAQWIGSDQKCQAELAKRLVDSFVIPGYEFICEVGRGGMGVVYKARQASLRRVVAVKMILTGPRASQEELVRFQREAELLGQLNHPNIVHIYSIDECDGKPYFTLEFCEGGSLDRVLLKNPQPPLKATSQLRLLALAVQAAHQKGVVHRDLKPANILLDGNGTLKITDFGLARKLDSAEQAEWQTKPDRVMGTAPYMAPEQARGLPNVGKPADIYALGAILYEMLTGQPPFVGLDIANMLRQIAETPPRSPRRLQPGIPRDLETICLKCLQKKPADRYKTAEALAQDLERFLAGQPILARPIGVPERVWRWCARNPRVAILTFLLMTSILTGAIIASVARIRGEHAQNEVDRMGVQKMREDAIKEREYVGEARTLLALAYCFQEAKRIGDTELEQLILYDIAVTASRLPQLQRMLSLQRRGPILDLIVGPTGDSIMIRGRDSIRFFTGRNSNELSDRSYGIDSVAAMAIAPSHQRFLTCDRAGVVKLWNATDSKEIKQFPIPGKATHVEFSPTGKSFIALYEDMSARIWNIDSAQSIELPHSAEITSFAFTPDGQVVVTASRDGRIVAWNAQKEEKIALTLRASGQPEITAMAFSPDGQYFVTGSQQGLVQLWDAKTRSQIGPDLPLRAKIQSVRFSPDNGMLLATTESGLAQVWYLTPRPKDGEAFEAGPTLDLLGKGCTAAFVFGSRALVTFRGDDEVIRIWRLDLPDRILLDSPIRSLHFGPNDTLLAGAANGELCRWDPQRGAAPLEKHKDSVNSVCVNADGGLGCSGSDDATARLWDLKSGKCINQFAHGAAVNAVAFSPNGVHLFTGGIGEGPHNDVFVKCWEHNALPGKPPVEFFAQRAEVHTIVVSPNSDSLLVGADAPEALLFKLNPQQKKTPYILSQENAQNRSVALSPDGQFALTGDSDGVGRLWRVRDGTQVHPPFVLPGTAPGKVPARSTAGVAFSPSSRHVVTIVDHDSLCRWDSGTGTQLGPPSRHLGRLRDVTFHPSKPFFFTGCETTAQLWDIRTGKPVAPAYHHPQRVNRVAISSSGIRCATGSIDGVVRIWPRWASLPAEYKKIITWCELVTGMELTSSAGARMLDEAEWQERQRELKQD